MITMNKNNLRYCILTLQYVKRHCVAGDLLVIIIINIIINFNIIIIVIIIIINMSLCTNSHSTNNY